MKLIPVVLIGFGIVMILVPEIISYLLGGFFIFLGMNGLFIGSLLKKFQRGGGENYVKFGKYKIYR